MGLGMIGLVLPIESIRIDKSAELDNKYLELLHAKFEKVGSGVNYSKESKSYTVIDSNLVSLNHQILLRQIVSSELMGFTLRRMDLLIGYLNTAFSIVFGLIVGFCINWYSLDTFGLFSLAKMFWVSPIIFYLVFGFFQARKAFTDLNEFEKRIVVTMYK